MIGKLIKKAKITSINYLDVHFIETELIQGQEVASKVIKQAKWDPHPDLKIAFDKLKFHVAYLCKITPHSELDEQLHKHPDLMEIMVTGFVTGGDEEHAGVTIIAKRQLDNGRVLNLLTPFTKFHDDHNPYKHGYELEQDVKACIDQVGLYLDGKAADMEIEPVPKQGDLFQHAPPVKGGIIDDLEDPDSFDLEPF